MAVALAAVVLLAVLIIAIPNGSCGIPHVQIMGDLALYDDILDPELCADLVERIDEFNSRCAPYVEMPDCG